jgi:radical SAM superfamily enzyme YgiQ (UPF0313 family)
MTTSQAIRGYEIAKQFKQRGVYTVLGGIHPTVCPAEAGEIGDTVFIGEAENTWPRFLEDFKLGNPAKIYKDSGIDISKSPVPRYDLIDTLKYHNLPLQTTRGCPHDCNFCTVKTVFGPKYRIKSTGQIVREMEAIQRVARNKRCIFNDDNMFVNKKKAFEILEAITPMKMMYFAQTDIAVADDDNLLKKLRDSGCVTLFIGFESLVPENLVYIDKTQWKLKQSQLYGEKCKRIQYHGIQVLGSFMIGLDYDSPQSLMRLKEFVLENNIWAQFLYVTPFPGTRMRAELIRQGRLAASDTNWDIYTCFDAVFKPLNMNIQELNDVALYIYESVYSDTAHQRRLRHMIEQLKMTWPAPINDTTC